MTETYPDDNTLLAIEQDDATGVAYIPTGQSPYVAAYRRMLYRLLRAAERANDLRVYDSGGLQVGVRGGRCFVGDQPRTIAPSDPISLAADSTTHLYIDIEGTIQTSTTGLPADRATFIPLAEVTTNASAVTQLIDLRGEAMLQAQTAALAGITASADAINQALDGIGAGVTAANLDTLTAGPDSTADAQHRHLSTDQDVDGDALVLFSNLSTDASANIGLALYLPNALPDACRLQIDRSNGYLQQSYLGQANHLVGATALQWTHPGALTASASGQLVGSVPIPGEVVAIILSARLNTQSSDPGDGLSLSAAVNSASLTATPAGLTSADGSGFRCTDQGDGTPAAIVSNGTQAVARGDLITLDLTYTANGTVSQPPTDVAALVVIKAGQPI